jgi:hypothetical protein
MSSECPVGNHDEFAQVPYSAASTLAAAAWRAASESWYVFFPSSLLCSTADRPLYAPRAVLLGL